MTEPIPVPEEHVGDQVTGAPEACALQATHHAVSVEYHPVGGTNSAEHDSAEHDSAEHDSAEHDSAEHDGAEHDSAGQDGRSAVLPAAAEHLWQQFASSADQRTRDRLVLHYAPLVKYVAGRVGTGLPAHVDVGDLVQSGIFGLVDAIEKFDPARGQRFETYAMQRIRGAILDDLRAQDWAPRGVRSRAREVERALERLGGRLQRTPSDHELAVELGTDVDELHDLYGKLRLTSVVAIEDLVGPDRDNGSIVDVLADDGADDPASALVDADNRRRLADAVAQLEQRDRAIVSLYYFESLTLAEIGRVLGVTESRVSQLHTRAVLRLRAKLGEQATS